jgi:glycosyltransferase involved in cell wall biosynthesis
METKIKEKIKILIVTDSAKIHTGLAETARLVFSRLLEKHPDQFDIHQHGWFNWNGPEDVSWPIYNTNLKTAANGRQELDPEDRYGQRTFEGVLDKVKPHIVWTNGDLWCFDHILNSPNRNLFRLIAYYTIDGAPYWGNSIKPGKSSEWGEKLVKADRLVVLTEWGRDTLKKSCPELVDKDIDVIYHPIDVSRFEVRDREQKLEIRNKMYNDNIPKDAFILGWVGRNQFRKQNYKMWEVMHYVTSGEYLACKDCEKITHKEYDHAARQTREVGTLMTYDKDYDYSYCWHCRSENISHGEPIDDIYLWLHMNKKDPGYSTDLHGTMWNVEDKCIYTEGLEQSKGLPPKVIADLISSWDCLLYLTGGEGFGIPAFEAMMSGVPVIYSNYSSHADFCQHGGMPVRINYISEMAFAIQRAIANTDDAISKVLWAYNNREDLVDLGAKGREFAMSKNLDSIVDAWHEMFIEMMEHPVAVADSSTIYAQVV